LLTSLVGNVASDTKVRHNTILDIKLALIETFNDNEAASGV
jgi:hypothetical protein